MPTEAWALTDLTPLQRVLGNLVAAGEAGWRLESLHEPVRAAQLRAAFKHLVAQSRAC